MRPENMLKQMDVLNKRPCFVYDWNISVIQLRCWFVKGYAYITDYMRERERERERECVCVCV